MASGLPEVYVFRLGLPKVIEPMCVGYSNIDFHGTGGDLLKTDGYLIWHEAMIHRNLGFFNHKMDSLQHFEKIDILC